jgi:hypothetical protein
VGCACSYGAMASLWSSSHPSLANLSACSLPLIFVWALTLCSVVVCVRDCSIVIIDSSMVLSGCLRWELKWRVWVTQILNPLYTRSLQRKIRECVLMTC